MEDQGLQKFIELATDGGSLVGVLAAFIWFAYKLLDRFDKMVSARDQAFQLTVDKIVKVHEDFATRTIATQEANTRALFDSAQSNKENSAAVRSLSEKMAQLGSRISETNQR